MAKRYLAWLYTKHFLIVLIVLELFFLLIDFLQNQKDLPDSANLSILYLYFESIAALKITLPLSLSFGALSTFLYLIRTNEIIALLSFGYSRKQIIQPIFAIASFFAFFFILINSTNVGYFYENGQSLLKNKDRSGATENLFFKFNDNYIYIQKLNPITQEAYGIKLFLLHNGAVESIVDSKKAKYTNDGWQLTNAKTIAIPTQMQISNSALKIEINQSIRTLSGFKPKVIDSVSNLNAALNITDMIDALFVLKNQDIDTERIRQLLFATILMPLLAPIAIIIMFAFAPISARFFNVTTFASSSIFIILGGFGIISALSKAKFENIHLSLVMLAVAIVLFYIAARLYKRELT